MLLFLFHSIETMLSKTHCKPCNYTVFKIILSEYDEINNQIHHSIFKRENAVGHVLTILIHLEFSSQCGLILTTDLIGYEERKC